MNRSEFLLSASATALTAQGERAHDRGLHRKHDEDPVVGEQCLKSSFY